MIDSHCQAHSSNIQAPPPICFPLFSSNTPLRTQDYYLLCCSVSWSENQSRTISFFKGSRSEHIIREEILPERKITWRALALDFQMWKWHMGMIRNIGFRPLVILQTCFLFLVQAMWRRAIWCCLLGFSPKVKAQGRWGSRCPGGHPPLNTPGIHGGSQSASWALSPAVNREGEPGVYQRRE